MKKTTLANVKNMSARNMNRNKGVQAEIKLGINAEGNLFSITRADPEFATSIKEETCLLEAQDITIGTTPMGSVHFGNIKVFPVKISQQLGCSESNLQTLVTAEEKVRKDLAMAAMALPKLLESFMELDAKEKKANHERYREERIKDLECDIRCAKLQKELEAVYAKETEEE